MNVEIRKVRGIHNTFRQLVFKPDSADDETFSELRVGLKTDTRPEDQVWYAQNVEEICFDIAQNEENKHPDEQEGNSDE